LAVGVRAETEELKTQLKEANLKAKKFEANIIELQMELSRLEEMIRTYEKKKKGKEGKTIKME